MAAELLLSVLLLYHIKLLLYGWCKFDDTFFDGRHEMIDE
jgi:hypothetical protein